MPQYPLVERIGMKALTSIYGKTMPMPESREVYPQFAMEVARVVNVADEVVRVTLRADELKTFELLGADEYFGLIMPPPGKALRLPAGGRINIRAEIAKMDELDRPDLRWYTIRSLRRDVGEIDVDIVTHGSSGPGSAWALQSAVGQQVGFRAGTGVYRASRDRACQLFVADETAIPALAAIGDALRAAGSDTSDIHAFVEIPDEAHAPPYDLPFDVTTLTRGTDKPGSKIVRAIEAHVHPDYDFAWACGESAIATGVRRHLVKTLGMNRKAVCFSGYWKLGAERT